MPALPNSVALQQQIDTLQSETQRTLEYAFEYLSVLSERPEQATQESADDIQNALTFVNSNMSSLQLIAQQAHSTLAAVAAYAQTVTEQRDQVVLAYKHAFEHGVLHAFECEACMEDARVESMANRMLETSIEEVGIEEATALNERLMDAVLLYEDWSQDIANDEQLISRDDRTALVGLIDEVAGGIDLDNVSYDGQQIFEDQMLIEGLISGNSPGEDDTDDYSEYEAQGA